MNDQPPDPTQPNPIVGAAPGDATTGRATDDATQVLPSVDASSGTVADGVAPTTGAAPQGPSRGVPAWAWVIVAAILLVGGGVVAAIVSGRGEPATSTTTSTSSTTSTPAAPTSSPTPTSRPTTTRPPTTSTPTTTTSSTTSSTSSVPEPIPPDSADVPAPPGP